MPFEIHEWLRRLFMAAEGKSCKTCVNYDGRFGNDTCFECLCNMKANGYESIGKYIRTECAA